MTATPPPADRSDRVPTDQFPAELPTMPPDGTGLAGDTMADTPRQTLERLAPGKLPLPRWFALLAGLCALGLVPWIVYLALNLPEHERAAHYDVAWVGFDIGMLAALIALAVLTVKRSTWTEPVAVFTGTMLVVDAWFDVVTARDREDFVLALLSAVVVELPLAVICFWMAHSTEVIRRRAYRALWTRATRGRGEPRA